MSCTTRPASGLVPSGKDVEIAIVISLLASDDVAEAVETGEAGAGAGDAVATVAEGAASAFDRNVPTSQVSLCGANVTSSPFIPVTKRPFTAVDPDPRKELSGCSERVKGPPEFCT